MLAIVNAAAEAYRGVIPGDCWHEPYMTRDEMERDIGAGVRFWGCESDGALVAVMGMQPVRDVDLIRHAYVLPAFQHRGIGGALLEYLRPQARGRILIGTWADAAWAIRFYEAHGFHRLAQAVATELMVKYWGIPPRQVGVSVVLEGSRVR